MGIGRKVVTVISLLFTLYLSFSFGLIGTLLGTAAIGLILRLTRRRKKGAEDLGIAAKSRPMSFGRFMSLLTIVAVLAIIYSPSTLRYSSEAMNESQGTSGPAQITDFVSFLRDSGYTVVLSNDTQTLRRELNAPGRVSYFLIGPDLERKLTRDEEIVQSRYLNGTLSLLVAEGNRTNNEFLRSLFDVEVSGSAIVDSSPTVDPSLRFKNDQVFTLIVHLDSDVTGLVDVASPIVMGNRTSLRPVASSGPGSYERSRDPAYMNTTRGPRTVVATGESNGARALLISDSAPFTSAFNFTDSTLGVDEKAFVAAMVGWTTQSDTNTKIIVDNSHYKPLSRQSSGFGLGVPVGPLFALALTVVLSATDAVYSLFLNIMRPFEVGLALLTVSFVYGMLTKKYAFEKRGEDDEPIPSVEKSIVAESQARLDFLTTSRNKGFYVATLAQLYDLLDIILSRETGVTTKSLTAEQLSKWLGEKDAREAKELLSQLSKIAEYASGRRRLLFPPVFRWKRLVTVSTRRAERVLNQLGLTISGEAESKAQLEYRLRG